MVRTIYHFASYANLKHSFLAFLLFALAGCFFSSSDELLMVENENPPTVIGGGIFIDELNEYPRNTPLRLLYKIDNFISPIKAGNQNGTFDVAGDGIYVIDRSGNLSALHIETRKVLWKTPTSIFADSTDKSLQSKDTEGDTEGDDDLNYHLAIINNKIIISAKDSLYAYAAAGGVKLWQIKLDAPLITDITGFEDLAIMQIATNETLGIDIYTGDVVWRHKPNKIQVSFASADKIKVSKQTAFLIYPNGQMFALNAKNGKLKWQTSFNLGLLNDISNNVNVGFYKSYLYGGAIFVITNDGVLVAINTKNGKILWKKKDLEGGAYLKIGGLRNIILIMDNKTKLSALNTTDGTEYWSLKLKPTFGGSDVGFYLPIYSNNRLVLFSTSSKVQLISIDTGRTIQVDKGWKVISYPKRGAGKIFTTDNKGTLRVYR